MPTAGVLPRRALAPGGSALRILSWTTELCRSTRTELFSPTVTAWVCYRHASRLMTCLPLYNGTVLVWLDGVSSTQNTAGYEVFNSFLYLIL